MLSVKFPVFSGLAMPQPALFALEDPPAPPALAPPAPPTQPFEHEYRQLARVHRYRSELLENSSDESVERAQLLLADDVMKRDR